MRTGVPPHFDEEDFEEEALRPQDEIHTVSALNRRIKGVLQAEVGRVRVMGEISNLRTPRSGHSYFTLKDEHSQLRAVLFRGAARHVKFELGDGLEVVATGEISVYEPRGEYQIVVSRLEPKGLGALQLAFEQRKEKLKKEGLFEADRKRPLPFLPRRIGVVTSATGAVIRDICNVALRRFPGISILLHPVRVQGEEAAGEIATAVETMNRISGIDVLIVGRGGGSLEDLWPFNEEVVARAVAASKIPVISAVGHEVDFTICDFVADRRAATPSEAAELAVPRFEDLIGRLDVLAGRLRESLRRAFEGPRARVEAAAVALAPSRRLRWIQEKQQRIDDLAERLEAGSRRFLARRRDGLESLAERLASLDPRRILARGYSVTQVLPGGKALMRAKDAPPGTKLKTLLSEGEVRSVSEGEP
ncbi:MAG: exodeoxyribonuclease VII large subunit [Planctomycetota bacterium]|jgi:exodeoxyribonuclease VII large subunit